MLQFQPVWFRICIPSQIVPGHCESRHSNSVEISDTHDNTKDLRPTTSKTLTTTVATNRASCGKQCAATDMNHDAAKKDQLKYLRKMHCTIVQGSTRNIRNNYIYLHIYLYIHTSTKSSEADGVPHTSTSWPDEDESETSAQSAHRLRTETDPPQHPEAEVA